MDTSNSKIKDFTQGNISKQLIVFSLPLFLSNLLQVFYNMVDMIIVGNVMGETGISAVSVGGDVTNLLMFMAIGFANAGQVLIAQYIGANKRENIGRFVGTMSGFLLVSALVFTTIGIIFQDLFLSLMNTPQVAFEGAAAYSLICIIGLVFIYGFNVVSAVLRGMGDSKHPFIFISIAAVLNVILDVVFVIYLDMGTAGAALATVISQAVSFITCLIYLYKHKLDFSLDITIKDFFIWNREMLSDLVKLGIPMAIKMASVQVSKLFVNAWVNVYGVAVSAFAGIANKMSSFSNLISAAMNTAGSTMVGQNIVAKKYDRVKKILKNLSVITLAVSTLLSILICVFPEETFSLFITEKDIGVLELVDGYIPIAVLLFYAAALRAIMNALINGSGNYVVNFATAILDGIVLRIGLSLLFGELLNMQYYGFWLGDALAGFTPFWIGLIYYFTGAWKKPRKKEQN